MRGTLTDTCSRVQTDSRIPVRRIPITQEFLAASIAEAEASGKPIDHPAGRYFGDALYASVTRMVGMIAGNFSESCREPSEDLMQECFSRVFKKIGKFDANKAKFTTWCWWVCMNTLRRRYQRGALRNNINNFEDPDVIAATAPAERKSEGYESILREEIIDVLEELAQRHPKHRKLIFEMFGNPVKGQSALPDKPMLAEAAESVGVTHQWAYSFYSRTVRPYFRRKFMEESNER